MCMGLDSAKEEMDDYENRFLARGLATLAFDGPGQGEAEYDFAICPEYEKPAKAVVDFVETRSDLDAGALGIWGVSLRRLLRAARRRVREALQGLRRALGRRSSAPPISPGARR